MIANRIFQTHSMPFMFWRILAPAFSALVINMVSILLVAAQEPINVELPDGFKIEKVAGNDLVPDAFCLTIHPSGNPVVAGPGYVRGLEDLDGDGQFETSVELLDGKIGGAQGLCFVGDNILCTANGGLNLCTPSSKGKAATVKRLFEITTGGEHNAHAIRVGPDGWIYVLAGNQTEILPLYCSGPNSPVKNPHAGFLMRFKLIDESCESFEIVCDGFRNAYDFDFGPDGSIFVYDSDGERDVSLPWYRTTRVFRMRSGDNAGWVSAGWKRPSYFFDMPETVAKLGRGSPTGVAMNPFHSETADSFGRRVFVCDWTFGRIVAVPASQPIDSSSANVDIVEEREAAFATARGQFGFAVTDLEFANANDLLVTVGGRGTEGALFRMHKQPPTVNAGQRGELSDNQAISKAFRKVRWETIDDSTIESLTKGIAIEAEAIRVAALESLVGHDQFLQDVGEEQRRFFVDSFGRLVSEPKLSPTLIRLSQRLLSQLSDDDRDEVLSKTSGNRRLLLSFNASQEHSDAARVSLLKKFINAKVDPVEQVVFIRAAQLVLGGCEGEGMFAGYTAKNLPVGKLVLDQNRLNLNALGQESRYEAGRLAAMLGYDSAMFRSHLVEQLTDTSHPVDDIHWLNCIAKTNGELDSNHIARIAKSLCRLRSVMRVSELPTDRNWIPRMQELTRELYRIPGLAMAVVESDFFGQSEHAFLFAGLEGKAKDLAQRNFATVAANDPSSVSRRQLEIVASNTTYKSVLRQFKQDESLFDVVVKGLSVDAETIDRSIFAEGLSSWNMGTVKTSAIALRRMGKPTVEPVELKTEFANAIQTAMRIGFDNQAVSIRDQIVLYLRTATGREFGYVERQPDPSSQLQASQIVAIEKWAKFLTEKFKFEIDTPVDSTKLLTRLQEIDFSKGDAERGREVFVKRQCATCHDAERGSKLGPPLEGIVNRFSKQNVFEAIIHPNAQVPDRYRALLVATEDGVLHKGTIIYESVDGITLMDVEGKTIRINKKDIEQRKRLDQSLMPGGLFDGISDREAADFWSYLERLK
jgi:putative heme-binding domain-containing protein